MALLSSEKYIENVANIIHKDTQQHPMRVDLTVAEVHRVTGAGSLDFGGSEFNPATTEKLDSKKQKEGDDYGWWKLGRGPYKLIFNEKLELPESTAALLVPHGHAREAGLIANTILLTETENGQELTMSVTVSEAGCNIKENARAAELYVLEN